MEMIIERDKCIKCGACAEVCPRCIIAVDEREGPDWFGGMKDLCIECGHCVAVCPTEAFSLETMKSTGCEDVREELNLSKEQVSQFIKSRRSIRVFKKDAVDKKIIKDVLDVVSYAPTGLNSQPVKWKVIYNKEKIVELKDLVIEWMKGALKEGHPMGEKYNFKGMIEICENGKDVILRDAPHLIIAYAAADNPSAKTNCTIALSNLDLAFYGHGVGTCWAGFLDVALMFFPKAQKALGLPEGYIACGSMMIGYPKYEYKKIPKRKATDVMWG